MFIQKKMHYYLWNNLDPNYCLLLCDSLFCWCFWQKVMVIIILAWNFSCNKCILNFLFEHCQLKLFFAEISCDSNNSWNNGAALHALMHTCHVKLKKFWKSNLICLFLDCCTHFLFFFFFSLQEDNYYIVLELKWAFQILVSLFTW